MLRNARLEQITKALECGELDTRSGLNQEMGFPRPGETRWGSHYKTVCNIISMYPSICDVLITLGDDPSHRLIEQKYILWLEHFSPLSLFSLHT